MILTKEYDNKTGMLQDISSRTSSISIREGLCQLGYFVEVLGNISKLLKAKSFFLTRINKTYVYIIWFSYSDFHLPRKQIIHFLHKATTAEYQLPSSSGGKLDFLFRLINEDKNQKIDQTEGKLIY